jgi:hypothetical protein
MALYLWIAGLVQGTSTAETFGRFDPAQTASPLTGALVHLAVSAVYGVIYGLGWRLAAGLPVLRRAPAWMAGAGYGLVLLALALGVILPGTASTVREVPLVHLAVAHVLYGVALGLLARRV